jgi:mannosyltransferase
MNKIHRKNSYVIILVSLIIIGSVLRFYHLGYNSLWQNEAFTLFTSSHSLAGIWEIVTNSLPGVANFTPTGEFSPPLFYCMEHFMLGFGRNEFVLRFMPALLGTLTIPVFYYIGREFADEDIGIVMAALVTISPFHVYYSQEARAYSAMLFFFSLAFFFFLVSLRTNEAYSWAFFGIFSGLTLWTHYCAFIPLGLLFMYAFFHGIVRTGNGAAQPLRYLLSFVTFLILVLPLMPLAISTYLKRTSIPPGLWGEKGPDVAFRIFRTLSEYHSSLMVVFSALCLMGIFFYWKTDRGKTILITGLLVIPVITNMVLSEKMPVFDRYLIVLLPFFFLGISLSLKPLARLSGGKDIVIAIIVIFFLIQVPFLASYYTTYFTGYSKEDWRGIAQGIEGNSTRGDYIIVIPYFEQVSLDVYYSNISQGTYEFGVRNESEIQQILLTVNHNHVYFVVSESEKIIDPDRNMIQDLQNTTKPIGIPGRLNLYRLHE